MKEPGPETIGTKHLCTASPKNTNISPPDKTKKSFKTFIVIHTASWLHCVFKLTVVEGATVVSSGREILGLLLISHPSRLWLI